MDFLGRAEFLRKWANLSLSKKRSRRGVFTAALLAATSSLRWLHHGCATKQDRFFPPTTAVGCFPSTDLLLWAVFRKMIVLKVTAGLAKVKLKNENRVAWAVLRFCRR
jgi:hypothetical protein